MNILRYGHDSFGEQVVNGVSWDLLPVAFWAGMAVVVVHLVYRAISRRRASKGKG
jgi:ABC-type proline/glycine betaine transport system permease subunit